MNNSKKNEVVVVKLSDIKVQRVLTFSKNKMKVDTYHKKNIEHLVRLWHTQDIDDAIQYVESILPPRKNPLHPQWWNKLNFKKYKNRGLGKANKYHTVVESLLEHGYAPDMFKSGYIKSDKKYRLIDGNHRFDLLFARYGRDHEFKLMVCGWWMHITSTMFATTIMTLFWIWFSLLCLMKLAWVIVMIPLWVTGFLVCNILKVFRLNICDKN